MRVFLCVFLFCFSLEADMIHQNVIKSKWIEERLTPFDEMMLSWNAKRPLNGQYIFQVSVKVDDKWSEWMPYASWGSDGQAGFLGEAKGFPAKVYQDAILVFDEKKATGFQIKVICEGRASLDDVYGLHVYTNSDVKEASSQAALKELVSLDVGGLSQMVLDHPRHKSLCSPTSTTAVLRYLLKSSDINPIDFAQNSWDARFDIYGNWVFNVVHASSLLGPKWDCWVERLCGFSEIHQRLQKGSPVVVSVRGPLEGGAQAYAKGHLLVVTGYDPVDKKVLCMDPAFESDDKTKVAYPLSNFMEAWGRRGNIAYIFKER